eukprot:5885770-Alexandrium_andersonii.AAC.1
MSLATGLIGTAVVRAYGSYLATRRSFPGSNPTAAAGIPCARIRKVPRSCADEASQPPAPIPSSGPEASAEQG